ncbi:MAG: hypothetical protein JSV03_14730 [Planctomycetota bacterium]|nr:MAG: hypothetical protein JSV03_14730 [Planctomycetota bacterium]
MSSIPPNLVGPILQSDLTQQQISSIRDNLRAQQADARNQQSTAVAEKDSTVETDDDDIRIHGDAEGGGSQGRYLTESEGNSENPTPCETDNFPEDQITHIDLEA